MSSPSIKMQNSNLDYLQIGEGAGNFSENTQKQLISCPDLSRLPTSLLHRFFFGWAKEFQNSVFNKHENAFQIMISQIRLFKPIIKKTVDVKKYFEK